MVGIGADHPVDPGTATGKRGQINGRVIRALDRREVHVVVLVAVLVLKIQGVAAVARPREPVNRPPRVGVDGTGIVPAQRADVNGAAAAVGGDPPESRAVWRYAVAPVGLAAGEEVAQRDQLGGRGAGRGGGDRRRRSGWRHGTTRRQDGSEREPRSGRRPPHVVLLRKPWPKKPPAGRPWACQWSGMFRMWSSTQNSPNCFAATSVKRSRMCATCWSGGVVP